MGPSAVLEKLLSVRHYCFQRGILGNHKKGHTEDAEQDFRQAFRTLNRLYVAQKRHNNRSERGAHG